MASFRRRQKGDSQMEKHGFKYFRLLLPAAVVIALSLIVFGVTMAQQIPGLPKLPGINIPTLPGANQGFAGLAALTAAKELTSQNKTTYPTPNIAVSGNHIVIAWPNGVVSVETIADDGTLTRTVLGPPTESNIPSARK
jgi:hypothetical protein